MKLYDTLSRQTQSLKPLEGKTVKMYNCGLTVYSQPHLGNWIGYIYWDVLVRTLIASGYEVVRTQNITDVGHLISDDDNGEDKMEKGAKREGLTAWDVAEKYINIANQEAKQLDLLPPTHLVRATDMIDQQIDFAKKLDEKGYLYKIDGDGMYFDTSKLADYGKLARLDIDGLEAGARVSVAGKHNITDFAVWKFSPVDSRRDMEWDSPWGVGFPGWHLECSVIAQQTLGDQIDIHTGGIDHIPVHHTNEIAQTESLTGQPFSKLWLHNNHLKADGKKMSKSLGNIYTLEDIIDHGYGLIAFKVFALSKHYKTEGNFTWENLEAASHRLEAWQRTFDLLWQTDQQETPTDDSSVLNDFKNALVDDDLNTPAALGEIDKLVSKVEQEGLTAENIYSLNQMADLAERYLGLSLKRVDISAGQKQIINERNVARQNKDWAKSDQLRAQLEAEGIGLNDNQDATTWFWL